MITRFIVESIKYQKILKYVHQIFLFILFQLLLKSNQESKTTQIVIYCHIWQEEAANSLIYEGGTDWYLKFELKNYFIN